MASKSHGVRFGRAALARFLGRYAANCQLPTDGAVGHASSLRAVRAA